MPNEIRNNPENAIMLYYCINIKPWHDAARRAVAEFNEQHPDKRLKERESKKLWNLCFESKNSQQNIELKIKQQPYIDGFRTHLKGPNLDKEDTLHTPDTIYKTIRHRLFNHLAKKEI